MIQILEYLRKEIIQAISAAEYLINDMSVGSNIIKVKRAGIKWDVGEEIVVRNDDLGEAFTVERIIDRETIQTTKPATHDWLVSQRAQCNRAVGYHYLKYVLLGDQNVIPDYPAVTLEANTKAIEWMTIPGTTNEFTVTIAVYVLEDNTEASYKLLLQYTSAIEEMLMHNLHPEISAAEQILQYDVVYGESLIVVPDATIWDINDLFVIEDDYHKDMLEVKRIIDPITLELSRGVHFDFHVADGSVAKKFRRYFYDSRVTNITYGYKQKGSAFLKASQINSYTKEERTLLQPCQAQKPPFLPDAPEN